ncbi:sarcosine oxidase subunit delta [Sphingomonas sp. CGMCC 1.13654]|uniref:Sarcosine oxidase subunit delta n=1 Tax=Sphingomonas chungangi TaxID=2683589 RepID=A0A838L3C8_9SPHN|nr:sarcosine oxidase subunit delta [Sphingomonas chungangi]MBA2933983.1 sarcosine oxidase subunit delta [Sphingomonas chungangi]MVW57108.1 sarcosine oxidase subunit delta [Sphingomonas chungangi]
MLQIPCPWCGPRNEIEFLARGPVVARPDPDGADDAAWTAFLYRADNQRGWLREWWLHVHGCGQLFVIRRHSVTDEIGPADEMAPGA